MPNENASSINPWGKRWRRRKVYKIRAVTTAAVIQIAFASTPVVR
jgi:hypothetical protein